MAHADDDGIDRGIVVEVVFCPRPGVADVVELRLPTGARLRDAVAASALAVRHPEVDVARAGIWGSLKKPDTVLRDGDRVELYRPLQVDPKEARRLRQRGQRAARTGAGKPSGSRSR
jgi:putative ubiquitin-RnfH superfamily antitoxin RatB of RatAB toxin-antitoxin module